MPELKIREGNDGKPEVSINVTKDDLDFTIALIERCIRQKLNLIKDGNILKLFANEFNDYPPEANQDVKVGGTDGEDDEVPLKESER